LPRLLPTLYPIPPPPPLLPTLSLHDALPIWHFPAAAWHPVALGVSRCVLPFPGHGPTAHQPASDRLWRKSDGVHANRCWAVRRQDRKSTRLNSSHVAISYAVFCLKKKKNVML